MRARPDLETDGPFSGARWTRSTASRSARAGSGTLPRHGAFAEPLACTLHGLDIGAPKPGERVLVIGGGVIGLLALQLARLAGAEATLLTRHPDKRALALTIGATATAATPDEVRAIWPEGADLVLECAGVAETVAEAPSLTRAGGRIVAKRVASRSGTRQPARAAPAGLEIAFKVEPGRSTTTIGARSAIARQ